MNHEDWTCRILLGDTCVNQVLRELGRISRKVASVINKTYDKPIVINLVTSPLDADRMDYLLRDAYYTGVNYGTIDIDRILRIFAAVSGSGRGEGIRYACRRGLPDVKVSDVLAGVFSSRHSKLRNHPAPNLPPGQGTV